MDNVSKTPNKDPVTSSSGPNRTDSEETVSVAYALIPRGFLSRHSLWLPKPKLPPSLVIPEESHHQPRCPDQGAGHPHPQTSSTTPVVSPHAQRSTGSSSPDTINLRPMGTDSGNQDMQGEVEAAEEVFADEDKASS